MKSEIENGFTLIETLIVMVIIGILAGIASPSMRTLIERNRTDAQIRGLFESIVAARSESITRNQATTLCKSSDRESCTASGNWEQGWLVYVDSNGNASLDSTEDVIRSHKALETNYTLRAVSPLTNTVSFRANGTTTDSGSLRLCPPSNDTTLGYTIVLNITGRARLSKEVSECP